MSIKCVTAIKNAFPRLDEKDVKQLAEELQEALARGSDKGQSPDMVIREEVLKLAKRLEHNIAIERRNRALNFLSETRAFNYVTTTWGDDLAKGFETLLVGMQSGRAGTRNSVAALQRGLVNKYIGAFLSDLTKYNLHKIVSSRQFDKELFEVSWILGEKGDVSSYPKEVVDTAKIINKHTEIMRREANAAGADIGKLAGWLIKQTHNKSRIKKAGQDEWVAYVSERLDFEKTMPDLAPENRVKVLRKLYKRFALGEHIKSTGPVKTGFKSIGNVAKSLSHERVLYFKDGTSAYDYHSKFGDGSVSDSLMGSFLRMGETTAMMRFFGPNARTTIDNIYKRLQKKLETEDAPDAVTQQANLSKKYEFAKKAIIPNLDGSSRIVGSQIAASVFAGVRLSQIMSKLGMATVSAFTDLPIYASEVSYQGGNFMGALGQAASGLIKGIGQKRSAEELQILSELNVLAQGLAETVSPRYDMADAMPGTIQKLTAQFMKLNALQWWTDRLRTTFALGSAHRLGLNKNVSYGKLNKELARALGLFGIDAPRWDLIRKGTTREADGKAYLTTESIRELPDAEVAKYLRKIKIEPTKTLIERTKTELADQLGSYYEDRAAHAVIESDAKTRSWLHQGTKPGTWTGEALRTLTLFKSFPTAVLQKVIGRELYGRSEQTKLKDILQNGNGELAGLARVMVSTTVAGYIAMTTKDLLKNKTPKDITKAPGKILLASMLQGGALGIYGDFLFGDMRTRYGGNVVTTLAGPGVQLGADLYDLMAEVVFGDKAGQKAVKLLKNNLPYGNLPPTVALNQMFFWDWSNQINPGYAFRAEQRLKREYGQTLLIK